MEPRDPVEPRDPKDDLTVRREEGLPNCLKVVSGCANCLKVGGIC